MTVEQENVGSSVTKSILPCSMTEIGSNFFLFQNEMRAEGEGSALERGHSLRNKSIDSFTSFSLDEAGFNSYGVPESVVFLQ